MDNKNSSKLSSNVLFYSFSWMEAKCIGIVAACSFACKYLLGWMDFMSIYSGGKREQEEQKAGRQGWDPWRATPPSCPNSCVEFAVPVQTAVCMLTVLCMELTVFDYDAVSTKTLSTVGCWTRKRARNRYGNRVRNRYRNRLCEYMYFRFWQRAQW